MKRRDFIKTLMVSTAGTVVPINLFALTKEEETSFSVEENFIARNKTVFDCWQITDEFKEKLCFGNINLSNAQFVILLNTVEKSYKQEISTYFDEKKFSFNSKVSRIIFKNLPACQLHEVSIYAVNKFNSLKICYLSFLPDFNIPANSDVTIAMDSAGIFTIK